MTIKELKEQIADYPEDAEVFVSNGGGEEGGLWTPRWVPFNGAYAIIYDYRDYSNNNNLGGL